MEAASMSVFVTPISYVIGFLGLIIVLSMLKSFVSHGVAIAIGEFLLNSQEDQRMKIVRWFSNQDEILACLKEIEEKTKG